MDDLQFILQIAVLFWHLSLWEPIFSMRLLLIAHMLTPQLSLVFFSFNFCWVQQCNKIMFYLGFSCFSVEESFRVCSLIYCWVWYLILAIKILIWYVFWENTSEWQSIFSLWRKIITNFKCFCFHLKYFILSA